MNDDISIIYLSKGIGCCICVTGCSSTTIELKRRSNPEIVSPPISFTAWEHERLRNRGLLQYTTPFWTIGGTR
ncbi:hypothetical protein ACFLYL_00570 [Chloroflexota bacterium]